VLLALLAALPAHALEEACSGATTADIAALIDQADGLLKRGQLEATFHVLEEARHDCLCLDEPAQQAVLGRLAGMLSLLYFFDQDEILATSWGLAWRYNSSDKPWPIDPPQRYLDMVLGAADTEVGTGSGGVAHTADIAWFLDGTLLAEPKAHRDVPHLLQAVEKDGVDIGFWIDGPNLEGDAAGAAAPPPKWAAKKSPDSFQPPAEKPKMTAGKKDQGAGREAGSVSRADPKTYMPNCRWAGQPIEAAWKGMVLTVNGRDYDVDTNVGYADLKGDLEYCLEFRAIRHLERVRAASGKADVSYQGLEIRDLAAMGKGVANAGAVQVHKGNLVHALKDDNSGDGPKE
jgi:hypothetical protein